MFKTRGNINLHVLALLPFPTYHTQIHNFRPIEKCKHPAHKTRRVKNPSGSSSSFFMLSTRTQAKKGDGVALASDSRGSPLACVGENPGSEKYYTQRWSTWRAFLCAPGACARAYFRGRKSTIIILLSFLSVCCTLDPLLYILCLLLTPGQPPVLLRLYLKLHLESVLSAASTHSSCSTGVSERVRVKRKEKVCHKRSQTRSQWDILSRVLHARRWLLGKLEGTHTLIYLTLNPVPELSGQSKQRWKSLIYWT